MRQTPEILQQFCLFLHLNGDPELVHQLVVALFTQIKAVPLTVLFRKIVPRDFKPRSSRMIPSFTINRFPHQLQCTDSSSLSFLYFLIFPLTFLLCKYQPLPLR